MKEIRNEIDEFFIETAYRLAKRSKCVSKQVGAVLVKDGRIVSMGYNGTASGRSHCCDRFDRENFDLEEHHTWSLVHEIHAEMNCLMFAAKNGIQTSECTIYTTLSPCSECLKNCIQAGIKRFVFLVQYHRNTIPADLEEFMMSQGITIERLIPSRMFLTIEECCDLYMSGKDSTSLRDSVVYYTSWIPDRCITREREMVQRMYHLIENFNEIPICPVSGDPQEFGEKMYLGFSRKVLAENSSNTL
jgi:dCMP deaminase